MKQCIKCGKEENYYARGLCGLCYNKKRYIDIYSHSQEYKDKKSIIGKEYYLKNKEKILNRQKELRSINGDIIRERVKVSQRKHRSKLKMSGLNDADLYLFGGNKIKVYERDGYSCVSCGLLEKMSIRMYGVKLLIHHIDGNGTGKGVDEKNNDISNLVTLCIPCHNKEHQRWKHGMYHKTLEDFLN